MSKFPQHSLYTSITQDARAYLLSQLIAQSGHIIYVTIDDQEMLQLASRVSFFSPETKVITIPAWDSLPYDRVSPNSDVVTKRIEGLCNIINSTETEKCLVITPFSSLIQRLLPARTLQNFCITLNKGQEYPREELLSTLIAYGFLRSETVTDSGEFAVRGSIIDLKLSGYSDGIRLDFFGNKIDSIKCFNLATQASSDFLQKITIIPAREVILTAPSVQLFRQNYRQLFTTNGLSDPLYDAISNFRQYIGMEHWLPLFYDKMENIFDYLPGALLVYDLQIEPALEDQFRLINEYYQTRVTNKGAGYFPVPPDLLWLTRGELEQKILSCKQIKFTAFAKDQTITKEHIIDLGFKKFVSLLDSSKTSSAFELLKTYLQPKHSNSNRPEKRRKIFIACGSAGARERIYNMLGSVDIHTMMIDDWQEHKQVSGKTIGLIILDLDYGFETEDFTIISEQDLLGHKIAQPRKTRSKIEKFLNEAETFNEGELVVHIDHGIGIFEGLETLTVLGVPHDCLRLTYAGGDKLYLPVENIALISRYGTAEGIALDRLGAAVWQMRKAKLKNRIKIAAEELLKIAAERKSHQAEIIVAHSGLYEEFCNHFQYKETDDQLSATSDIREDLSSGTPMDRLICGDVGFGKTEVALRAAFMVVSDQEDGEVRKQVAIIVPTTLLCRQHYKTFKTRFHGFPFRIRQLSRLVTSKEAAETKELLKNGQIDIIIGTHALLSKEIKFNNLCLTIVDEEQHFGVLQKERLKQLKANIHVLTLSATPIPRTLQMSLTGIKELSLIATSPVDRQAVRTFVMPYDPIIIREAILREYTRGGRCFYVAPRISDLANLEKSLKELVPEVKIVVAHGQLPAATLDKIMNDFYDGVYDLLLATTIIESGLDIESANTMIIHRADMFGLSQLYQLRGRVGRSKVRAYAYLTLPPKMNISKIALQRLEIMQSLDSLGAGFTVASHDMDIRGFGNLVGDEQSGHIREVGIELYQEMLREAVEQLQSSRQDNNQKPTQDKWTPQINIGLSVLIPENYVAELHLRLGLYKRVASVANEQELESFAAEMIDRFGPMPLETSHLIEIVKLKQLCVRAGIEKIDCGPKGVVISFKDNVFANPEKLLDYVFKHPEQTKLRADQKLVIIDEFGNEQEKLRKIRNLLQLLCDFANSK